MRGFGQNISTRGKIRGWGKCKCEKSPRCRKKDNAGRRTPDETAKVWLSVDKPDLRCKRFVDKVCPL